MPEFLLEILCDELPPELQKSAVEQALRGFEKSDIKIDEAYHGARRLTFNTIWDSTKAQTEKKIEKGPKKNASDEILGKFCEKWQTKKDMLEVHEYKGVEYYCHVQSTEISEPEFLVKTFLKILGEMSFSRQMDWSGNKGVKWPRPIISIVALYKTGLNEKFSVLNFEFAGVRSSDFTFAHQIVNHNRKITLRNISNSNEYHYELAKKFCHC